MATRTPTARNLSSPERLAAFAKRYGGKNLQKQLWWSSSPYRYAAWDIITGQPAGTTKPPKTISINPDIGKLPTPGPDLTTPPPQQDPTKGAVDPEALKNGIKIIQESWLPDDVKAVWIQSLQSYDFSKPIDFKSILDNFQKLKNETIDPKFYEIANAAIDEMTRAKNYQEAANAREMEAVRAKTQENIRSTQADLEARGMTFSGEGVRQLGGISAFAQPGSAAAAKSAIPLQEIPFGGTSLPEGLVNQENRLLSSSTLARQTNEMQNLQRQAESYLGSAPMTYQRINPITGQMETSTADIRNIFSEAPLGDMTGAFNEARVKSYADQLNRLAGQSSINTQAQEPLKFKFNF